MPVMRCASIFRRLPTPRAAYYDYTFNQTEFPDYPKYAVHPDAYFVSFQIAGDGGPSNPVVALDRERMLAGLAPRPFQRFDAALMAGFTFQALTPADLDGPAGDIPGADLHAASRRRNHQRRAQ